MLTGKRLSYYKTCRKHEKDLRKLSKTLIKKAEQRHDKDVKERGDPLQELCLYGQSCNLNEDNRSFDTTQSIVSYNNKPDYLMDKYDCRLLINFMRKSSNKNNKQNISSKQKELNVLLNYERYRSLIHYDLSNKSEKERLGEVEDCLKAKLVKMKHINSNESNSDSDHQSFDNYDYANRDNDNHDRMNITGKRYGIVNFEKIEKFNYVFEHNKKAIESRKKDALILKEKRNKERRRRRRRRHSPRKFIIPKPKTKKDTLLYHSMSSDSEKIIKKKKRKTKSIVDEINCLAEEKKEKGNCSTLKAPKSSTMEEFFTDLNPVCVKEEAMNFTHYDIKKKIDEGSAKDVKCNYSSENSSISVNNSLSENESNIESESDSKQKKDRIQSKDSTESDTEHVEYKKVIKKVKKKLRPSEKIREKIRSAFKSRIKQEKWNKRKRNSSESDYGDSIINKISKNVKI